MGKNLLFKSVLVHCIWCCWSSDKIKEPNICCDDEKKVVMPSSICRLKKRTTVFSVSKETLKPDDFLCIHYLPRSDAMVKNQTMTRTVHGFETKHLLLRFKLEHSVGIMFPMTRSLPQLWVVNVGRDDLLEAAFVILASNEID